MFEARFYNFICLSRMEKHSNIFSYFPKPINERVQNSDFWNTKMLKTSLGYLFDRIVSIFDRILKKYK